MNNNLIVQSRKANLVEYLRNNGYILLKEGRQYRVRNYSGLVVSRNMWYNHQLSIGGNTLDFLIKIENIPFKKAVDMLSTAEINLIKDINTTRNNSLVLPKRNIDDKRVIAYLIKTRRLSSSVVIPLIKLGRIYEAHQTHNCVITGIDENHSIRYALQRSCFPNSNLKFESKGSDKRYSFSLAGSNDILCIFESPIDLLSYRTIYLHSTRLQSHMLSLGGVCDTALNSYLNSKPQIHKLVFCLDNDKSGIQAYSKFYNIYTSKGFKVYKNFPNMKDWNLQLLNTAG
ncbi:toprim domain-containing protein [Herbivorax sp. ANBcel31]|uniref:toprim domain-containing protein n=1 Tax=Herbivorax sp. ANBcel31 TaxID=3069754 RepID=UPI0027ADE994|nr:toprim domain-containing protein [Herbivorax sp. ANBcel31]MDQ2088201.1 toprim domain-containing protein [Herbivorax sp. ANBcel31]